MLYLFYGPDEFRIRQKIKEIIRRYRNKYPDAEVVYLNSFDLLKEQLKIRSLFVPKKLLILSESLYRLQDKVDALKNIIKDYSLKNSTEAFVIFYLKDVLKSIDEKKPLLNFLIKNSKTQKFNLLDFSGLKKYIIQNFNQEGFIISKAAVEKLIFLGDNSLENITAEIEKLKIYKCKEKKISEADVDKICAFKIADINLFHFIDSLSRRNKKDFFAILEKCLNFGIKDEEIFSKIIFQIKNLLVAKCYFLDGGRSYFDLSNKFKMHPFVAKKSAFSQQNFSLEDLQAMLTELFSIDYKIKTGYLEIGEMLVRFLMEI